MAVLYLVMVAAMMPMYVTTSYVQPTVTLNTCIGGAVDFTITNMTAGGLIYIRTYLAFNILPTTDGTMNYECLFDDCGIAWNVKFKLIVQRKVLYQTADDVMMTFICMGDVMPVMSISSSNGGMPDENMTTVTYKPEVAMTFYSEGSELKGGSVVKLGTGVDLAIEVTNNIGDMFDISVMFCFMSSIQLYEDFCPVHPDVFGLFTRVVNGNLSNTFQMFKPTTTEGGDAEVIISCVLKVCMGTCDWGCSSDTGVRKRRDNEDIAPGEGKKIEDNSIYVGKMFTVTAGDRSESKSQDGEGLCIHVTAAAVLLGFLGLVFMVSLAFSVYLCRKYILLSKSETTKTSESVTSSDNASTDSGSDVIEVKTVPEDHTESLEEKQQPMPLTSATTSSEGYTISTTTSSGEENQGFGDDDDTLQGPVLYTNKARRRSSLFEAPLLQLQKIISKVAPGSGIGKGVIEYKGILHGVKNTRDVEQTNHKADDTVAEVNGSDDASVSGEKAEEDKMQ